MKQDKQSLRRGHFTPGCTNYEREENPFYWLAMLNGSYRDAMEHSLKRIGLDLSQWRVLSILRENDAVSVSEIAHHAVLRLPAATRLLARMQNDGKVLTRQHHQDGRVTEVQITEKGRKCWSLANDRANRIYAKALNGITVPRIRSLNETIGMILKNIS